MTECVELTRLDAKRRPLKGRWAPEVHARLVRLIEARGVSSKSYDPCSRPLAVFDLGHTIMHGDLGERFLEADLQRPQFRLPAAALHALPADLAKAVKTSSAADLRYQVHRTYRELDARFGRASAAGWLARIYAGSESTVLLPLADGVIATALQEPISMLEIPGPESQSVLIPHGLRIRPEMTDLMAVMEANGFDVYVVTAISEWLARRLAPRLGVSADRILGMRATEERLVNPLTADGGKVQAVRTRIPSGGRVPVFAIADAGSDLPILSDATDLAILFDRGFEDVRNAAETRGFAIQPTFEER